MLDIFAEKKRVKRGKKGEKRTKRGKKEREKNKKGQKRDKKGTKKGKKIVPSVEDPENVESLLLQSFSRLVVNGM